MEERNCGGRGRGEGKSKRRRVVRQGQAAQIHVDRDGSETWCMGSQLVGKIALKWWSNGGQMVVK